MISIVALWLPIILAGVLVFVASSVVHMVLPYHRNDYRRIPDEDAAMAALRPLAIPAGDYMMPYAGTADAMRSDAFRTKVAQGPVASFTILPPNAMANMGSQLVQWFAYTLLVGVLAAYVAGRTLPPGAPYLEVFRLTGTTAFACYAMALPQQSIWYFKSWGATLRSMFDGLIYALLTAGMFGWLWPA